MKQLLTRYASVLYTPPFGKAVPSNAKIFVASISLARSVWRRLKRDIALFLTGQLLCCKSKIPENAKRVLYVYLGTPQLGDSIMDLSARTLWSLRDIRVDMLTHPSVASFYANDPSFHRVLTRSEDLEASYDFVVLQSYGWKCLKVKWRYFLSTPFLALHGHFYGPQFNRLVFAQKAWAHALDLSHFPGELPQVKSVFNLKLDHSQKPRQPRTLALCLGGVDTQRTYAHWAEFVRFMHKAQTDIHWVLLGSANGLKAVQDIMAVFKPLKQPLHVENLVDQLTLPQVFEKLQTVRFVVTADGGLMHLAKSAQAPMLALFTGAIHPRMRFDVSDPACAVHAPDSVSDIPPQQIAALVIQSLQLPLKFLTDLYLDEQPDCSEI